MSDEILIDYQPFDEENKNGPCIVYNEEKTMRVGKPCYSVQDFSQIDPDMSVYIAEFDGCCLDKNCFYYCLMCLSNPRDSVVYRDGTIVSVGWNKNKRSCYKGFYANKFVVPIVTIVINGNNICTRFYENRVHFTGKLYESDLDKVVTIITGILQETRDFWELCQNNPALFIESTNWLADYSSISKNEVVIKNNRGESRSDYYVSWPGEAPSVYCEFVEAIVDRYADTDFVSQLKERTKDILACTSPPVSKTCVCLGVRSSLKRYIYNIGFPIDPEEVVNYLAEVGYEITGHDANGPSIKIQIIDRNNYPDDHLISRKNIYSQNLLFSPRGTLHHSGPGHQRHEIAYKNLMYHIITMYHS